MLRVLMAFVLLPFASAQSPDASPSQPEQLLLWPDGAPQASGTAAKDKCGLIVYHAAAKPTADADPRHAAVVICPGGGYGGLAMDHEGHQIAAWLHTLRITGVILDYRHRGKGYGHPAPLQDAQRAIRLVRQHADDWHLDPTKIGVLGFSAGGHLASSVSVHHDAGDAAAEDPIERQSCRPDFAVLCYPVIAFGQEFTHKGSQRNLLGPDASPELIEQMSSERQVDARTPPTFLWHTSADRGVSAENSVVYYLALLKHEVPCELHVFEQGRHGIGLGKGLAAETWPVLCQRWLVTRGVLTE